MSNSKELSLEELKNKIDELTSALEELTQREKTFKSNLDNNTFSVIDSILQSETLNLKNNKPTIKRINLALPEETYIDLKIIAKMLEASVTETINIIVSDKLDKIRKLENFKQWKEKYTNK